MDTEKNDTKDEGKAKECRPELIPVECLEAMGKVLAFGANKYSAYGWKKMERESLKEGYAGSLMRHFIAMRKGEALDPESGMLHAAHLASNAMVLLWAALQDTSKDEGLPRHTTEQLEALSCAHLTPENGR